MFQTFGQMVMVGPTTLKLMNERINEGGAAPPRTVMSVLTVTRF